MKVWVVEHGEYSDRSVTGVYSTEENAQIAAKHTGDVTEYEMDIAINKFRSGLSPFCVEMGKEGEVFKISNWGYWAEVAPEYRITISYPTGRRPARLHLEGILWAKSEEQAIKATNEQRAQAIASGEWDAKEVEQWKRDRENEEAERRFLKSAGLAPREVPIYKDRDEA